MKNKISNSKGSITLFVLISVLFFLVVVSGIYIGVSNRTQKQERDIQKIQQVYEKENVDDLYNKSIENKK